MQKPTCTKCGSADFLILEDQGPTFQAWRCAHCDLRTERKTSFGQTLPWVGPVVAIAIAILTGGDAPDIGD